MITLPDGTTWAWNGRAWLLDSMPMGYKGVHYISGTICWPPMRQAETCPWPPIS